MIVLWHASEVFFFFGFVFVFVLFCSVCSLSRSPLPWLCFNVVVSFEAVIDALYSFHFTNATEKPEKKGRRRRRRCGVAVTSPWGGRGVAIKLRWRHRGLAMMPLGVSAVGTQPGHASPWRYRGVAGRLLRCRQGVDGVVT